LASGLRRQLEDGSPLNPKTINSNIPMGPPGSAWAFVSITRWDEGRGRERQSARVLSPKSWAWFLDQLDDPPLDATLGTSILDEHGYTHDRPIHIDLQRDMDSPGWTRLMVSISRDTLTQAEQLVWLELLHQVAARVNPSFGIIDYGHGGAEARTAVELTSGPPWRGAWQGVRESREVLRGYGWWMILAEELAQRLGGPRRLAASGAFTSVQALPAGGVCLQASADYRDYDQAAVERVWQVIAPTLPKVTPMRHELMPGQKPRRVVYRHPDEADPAT
jgi:hypothetical protein